MVLNWQQKKELEKKSFAETRTAVVAAVQGRMARLTFMPENHTSSKWFESLTDTLAVGQLVQLTRVAGSYQIVGPLAAGGTVARRYLFNGGVFSPASNSAKYLTQGNFEQLRVDRTISASCEAKSDSLFLVYLASAVDVTGWNVLRLRLRSTGWRSLIGIQRTPQVNVSPSEGWLAWGYWESDSIQELAVNVAAISGLAYPAVEQAGDLANNKRGIVEIESIALTMT